MRNNVYQSGRTMLEMLAVLGIVAILTLGSMTGYNYLVQKQKQNEVVRDVNDLVLALKTSGMARKHNKGSIIPAGTIVQSPHVAPDRKRLKLPDGMDSWAIVSSLEGDGFLVALQVDPGTCAELFKGLSDNYAYFEETLSSVNNMENYGLNKINNLNYTKSDALVQCMENGKVLFAVDCPAHTYIYDNECHTCPEGETPDIKGTCCRPGSRCGNVCSCEANTYCDTSKNACAECLNNAHCDGKGWPRHTCDTHKNICIECMADMDCHKVDNPNPKNKYCVYEQCVECRKDEDCCEIVGGKKVCNKICDSNNVCTDPCPTGTINHNGECVVCYDSASGTGRDIGCPADKPMCNTSKTTTIDGVAYKGKCYACNTDADCPIDANQNYYCEDGTCKQCPTTHPFRKNNICKKCLDTEESLYKRDRGCNEIDNPICNETAASGSATCNPCPTDKPHWHSTYNECKECVTDEHCKSKEKVCNDAGICVPCSDKTPNKPNWSHSLKICVECDGHNASSTGEFKCPSGKPYCDSDHLCKTCEDATSSQVPVKKLWSVSDQSCAVCRNDKTGNNNNQKDTGCDYSSEATLCTTKTDNGYANSCSKCQNDHGNTTKDADSGCSGNKKACDATATNFGSACVECNDDSFCKNRTDGKTWCDTKTKTCVGCNGHYSSNATRSCGSNKPYCDSGVCKTCTDLGARTTVGPTKNQVKTKFGQNSKGSLGCYLCIDDKNNQGHDDGCDSGHPVCGSLHARKDGYGHNVCCPLDKPYWSTADNACHACTSDSHCASGKICKDYTCQNPYTADDDGCTAKYNSNCSHYETWDGKTGCWNNGWAVTERDEGKCSESGWKFYGQPGKGVCKVFCGSI